ncbi:hypothetical protein RRG08_031827 [Elysia crispata]|uniref:Uncharacterized protein n=1 Tax=Elysia crispata TaxID=231223 RepID=A0AAE1CSY3_9GAST|nr:hypothetical protein RRG08_031827 [Elysia crispata]
MGAKVLNLGARGSQEAVKNSTASMLDGTSFQIRIIGGELYRHEEEEDEEGEMYLGTALVWSHQSHGVLAVCGGGGRKEGAHATRQVAPRLQTFGVIVLGSFVSFSPGPASHCDY